MLFPKCIYPKCIFAKCTRLACLLSFASLFHTKSRPWKRRRFFLSRRASTLTPIFPTSSGYIYSHLYISWKEILSGLDIFLQKNLYLDICLGMKYHPDNLSPPIVDVIFSCSPSRSFIFEETWSRVSFKRLIFKTLWRDLAKN